MVSRSDYIYVSCSGHDCAVAKTVVDHLKSKHYAVYRSEKNIVGDEPRLADMAENVKACKVLLCILSEHYLRSDYCLFESGIAHGKTTVCIKLGDFQLTGALGDMTENVRIVTINDDSAKEVRRACDELCAEGAFLSCLPSFRKEAVEGNKYRELLSIDECKQLDYNGNIHFTFDREQAPELLGQIKTDHKAIYDDGLESRLSDIFEAVKARSAALGYSFDNNKLWAKSIILEKSSDHQIRELRMEFGNIRYFEHHKIRALVAKEHPAELLMPFVNGEKSFRTCPWSISGGGAWVTTKDGYLIAPRRTDRVIEKPNCYGYSAAGGFEGYNDPDELPKDPFMAVADEILTELGVDINLYAVPGRPMKILSLGVDMERALIQFSFYVPVDLTFSRICRLKETASERHELELEKIPFVKDEVAAFLMSPKGQTMEPGAFASLFNIYQCFSDGEFDLYENR